MTVEECLNSAVYSIVWSLAFLVWRANTYMYIAFSLWDQKKDVQRRSQSFSEEKKKNLCREHTMGSHHALLENTTIIFCQLFPYAIPSRAPKIFFSLFSLGCALIPTSNNGPNSAFKKGRFVLGVIACVMRVAVTFQRR